MTVPASFKSVPTSPTLKTVALIAFCLSLGLMDPVHACYEIIEQRQKAGESNLNPTEGILVIGRGDTLHGTISTTWPRQMDGGWNAGPFLIRATHTTVFSNGSSNTEIYNDSDTPIRFRATGEIHDGSRITETSDWSMCLGDNPPPAGEYGVVIGHRFLDPSGNELTGEPFIFGRALRLFVLAEESFVVQVDPGSDFQVQGTVGTRTVHVVSPPGFTNPILLELVHPPPEITATFDPFIGNSSVMRLTVGNVAPIRYSLQVRATGGGLTKTTSFIVDVVPAQHIVLLEPHTLSLAPSRTGAVVVRVGGVHLPVSLQQPTEPDVSFQFSQNPTDSLSTLTVTVAAQAQLGNRIIPIIGTFSNGQQGRDTLLLRIDTVGTQVTTVLNSSAVLIGMDVRSPFGLAVGTAAYRSTNDGQTWNLIPGLPPPPFLVRDASIVGNLAIAAGGSGKIYVSTDAGVDWQERASGTTNQFFGTDLSPAGFGLAVGAQGTICRSINNGNTWASISSPSNETLWDVDFNGNTATIVGTAGTILRSTDVGVTWAQQPSGTTSHLHGVMFLNEDEGIAVGDFGTILKTVNGGAQWISLNSGTTEALFGIGLANSQKATAGGTFGLLIETFDGGQTWTPVSVPSQYIYEKVHVFSNNSALYLGQGSTGSIILRRE